MGIVRPYLDKEIHTRRYDVGFNNIYFFYCYVLYLICINICSSRYSDWKYDLHRHFLEFGDGRNGTPLEFERREYEWLHLKASHFRNPNFVVNKIISLYYFNKV